MNRTNRSTPGTIRTDSDNSDAWQNHQFRVFTGEQCRVSDEKPMDKRLKNLRPFRPGQSGNPGGRAKRGFDLRTLARQYTPEAIGRLIAVMRDANASSMARVRAAETIPDRGRGKAGQPQAPRDTDGN